MTTETKVVSGIVIVTILIIIGGLFVVNKQSNQAVNVAVKPELLEHADSPRIGSSTKVTIVEFADFECPACAALHPSLKQLLQTESEKFTLIYRHFPIHQHSFQAAEAALAANEQGKFWQMNDILFEKQDEWSLAASDSARAGLFDKYAQTIGLDVKAFDTAIKNNASKYDDTVRRDQADGQAMGIDSTPTLIINGTQVIRGAIPFDSLKQLVDQASTGNVTGGTVTSGSSTVASSTK